MNQMISIGSLILGLFIIMSGMRCEKSRDLNDAQIANIVLTANTGEVAEAQLATTNATDQRVKDFALQMQNDHSTSKSEVNALVGKVNLSPSESDTSKKLEIGSNQSVANLKKLQGADFDKAYVDAQVKAHTDVLSLFDQKLIPNAQNAELKALLVKTRPVIATHLEHARTLQSDLAKGPALPPTPTGTAPVPANPSTPHAPDSMEKPEKPST